LLAHNESLFLAVLSVSLVIAVALRRAVHRLLDGVRRLGQQQRLLLLLQPQRLEALGRVCGFK
jgi:hypothetical protein